jgi:TolB-like protein
MLDGAPELLTNKGPMVVGSVEDIHDVNTSTPFGNIISEMIRTRLVQRGLRVMDLRVRSSVLLERTSGEMLLSRDKRSLLPPPVAADIVTGTYAVGSGKVYVSLKIISANDARIEAAADFVAERTFDVDQLLLHGPG